jgi:hypothetical protein
MSCLQLFQSSASLHGTFYRDDGVIFTASMSASSTGCTLCQAQNSAQKNVENVLRDFIANYSPLITNYNIDYIDYTNKVGDEIINEPCIEINDTYKVKTKVYRFVNNYTATTPDIVKDVNSLTLHNDVDIYSDIDCTNQIGVGVHSHVILSRNGVMDIERNPSFHLNSVVYKPVICEIQNNRTLQMIETEMEIRYVNGSGNSDISIRSLEHKTTRANITLLGSKIFPNVFSIESVDGFIGNAISKFINKKEDGFIYEVNALWNKVN